MDSQQYLNQISEMSLLSSKFFLVGAIGVVLLIVIIIIGSILGGNKSDNKTLCYDLKLHLDNTAEVINEYQQYVKSSELRSSSASLLGVLTNTSRDLTTYLEDKYNFKDKDISKTMVEQADLVKDDFLNELFEAKINGILDRIYAHKMAYEISLLTAEESQLYNSSKDESLSNLPNTSYESLNNLYDKFNDFSETKN